MELTLIELLGMMAGTGATTGGVTLAGLRVHIQYLREQDKRHEAENEAMRARIDRVEQETRTTAEAAKRAHYRIDKMEGVRA